MRPTRHRLHVAPDLDDLDLDVFTWPVPLDPGDTLTLDAGRRFTVLTIVELRHGGAVDRLVEVEPTSCDWRSRWPSSSPPRKSASLTTGAGAATQ